MNFKEMERVGKEGGHFIKTKVERKRESEDSELEV